MSTGPSDKVRPSSIYARVVDGVVANQASLMSRHAVASLRDLGNCKS
jgi:hypothetical protein